MTRTERATSRVRPAHKRWRRKKPVMALDDELALSRPLSPLGVGCADDPVALWQQMRQLECLGGLLPVTVMNRGTRALQGHFLFRS